MLFFLVASLLGTSAISVAATLDLDATNGVNDAWPAVRMMSDPSRKLDINDVIHRRDDFRAPLGPVANLCIRHEAVWLRFQVRAQTNPSSAWIMSVNYPSLDFLDVYVLDEERPVKVARLGRLVPFSEKPLPSRLHAVAVNFEPGKTYEVLVRVETQSTMVVPISISTPEAFLAQESGAQGLQGLMLGVALCMFFYSLAQWVTMRDPMFLHYALALGGMAAFFLGYSGIGPQYFWGDSERVSSIVSPLSILVGLVGMSLFIDGALEVDRFAPRTSWMLKGIAVFSFVMSLAFALRLASLPDCAVHRHGLRPLADDPGRPGRLATRQARRAHWLPDAGGLVGAGLWCTGHGGLVARSDRMEFPELPRLPVRLPVRNADVDACAGHAD